MKRIFTLAASICFMSLQAQIVNPGFEEWTGGQPTGWETTNIPNFLTPVTQTSDAFQGSSAVQLDVLPSAFGNIPGTMTQLNIPISYTPESISFWMKSSFAGSNQLQVTATFSDGTTPTGTVTLNISENYPDYIEITIPVTGSGVSASVNQATLGFAIVGANGSLTTTTAGSVVKLDEMSFSTVELSAPSLEVSGGWNANVYPNPASGNQVNIAFSGLVNDQVTLDILDFAGKLVKRSQIFVSGEGQVAEVLVSDLVRGVYFVRITSDDEVRTLRFNKL